MDVISYKKAKRAEELADQIINGEIDTGVLQTKINEKLANLEVQYAPDLSTVKSLLAEIETQKLGGGILVSMPDLGQDVKTALTGGSVAVVDRGVINNIHINPGQITGDKLTTTITINKTDMEISHAGQYVKADGTFAVSASFNVRRIVIPADCKKIVFNGSSAITPNGVIKYDDGTINTIDLNKAYNTHYCEILLNEQISTTNGANSITMNFHTKGLKNEYQFDVVGKGELQGNGYIRNNLVTASNAFSRYKINIVSGYKYKATVSAIAGYIGCTYDVNGTYLGEITINSGYIKLTNDVAYIIINLAGDDTVYAEKIVSNKVYGHCVNKPFTFRDLAALFFGDSITQGYVNGSTISPENWVKKFSNKVGLTFTNKGIGGALFTSGKNAVETIPTTIKNTVLTNIPFLFIAGGTNDYGLGVELSEFEAAIADLCAYLKANYTGEVIFITPINRVTPSNNEKAPLDSYRNIIAEHALKNGYSVVDGSSFNFPIETGTYATSVFGDGLHPTELGYGVYAKNLATVLC